MQNEYESIVKNKNDDELLAMVYTLDMWNPSMMNAIQQELKKRGILPDDIAEQKKNIIEKEHEQLLVGKNASFLGLFVGFCGVLGIIGMLVGAHYYFSKTQSIYTQNIYYTFNEDSRYAGKLMLLISTIVSILAFMYLLTEGII